MKTANQLWQELEFARITYQDLVAAAENAIGYPHEAQYWKRADHHFERVLTPLKTDYELAKLQEERDRKSAEYRETLYHFEANTGRV
jgi:hypothetical protein